MILWCILPSKFRFPESTLPTTRSAFSIADSISGSRGPELPMQVVHPYPTTLKPRASRSSVRPAASKYSVTTRLPGAKLGFTHGLIVRPCFLALRASKPAATMTLGLLVLVQLVIAAITMSPCFSSQSRPSIIALAPFRDASTPCP
uniref:Uncharacterized protein n=1 Tax=uncultured marine group II/III euryarchaeote KM3_82_C12 TaxID=1456518 RepID=A0A075HPG9_9EURY|nr:hypothetical protein [uncultured marine group II/III euryarchaeote KM3_82_C12]